MKTGSSVYNLFVVVALFLLSGSNRNVNKEKVRSGDVGSGRAPSGQVSSGQVRSGQLRSGQVQNSRVWSHLSESVATVMKCSRQMLAQLRLPWQT